MTLLLKAVIAPPRSTEISIRQRSDAMREPGAIRHGDVTRKTINAREKFLFKHFFYFFPALFDSPQRRPYIVLEMGIVSFFKDRRRRAILKERALSDEDWAWALEQHPILRRLGPESARTLRDMAAVFAAEKSFTPLRDLTLTPDMVLSISVQAVLPVLSLGLDWLDDFKTVFITPRSYRHLRRERNGMIVREFMEDLGGMVTPYGPIMLSWRDVEASGWGDGYNVVIHEIAHKLDLSNRAMDGCPFLGEFIDPAHWQDVFTAAYQDLRRRLEQGMAGPPPLEPYAAESPIEFFAVACETFFEQPARLAHHYPDVYRELSVFFRQDPLSHTSP
jgi:Mlc titration factor MtfA (ptsG expression regulator)